MEMPHFLDLSVPQQLSILSVASYTGPLSITNYAMRFLATFRKQIRHHKPIGLDLANNEAYWQFRASLTYSSLVENWQDLKEPKLIAWAETMLTGCIFQAEWSEELQKELSTHFTVERLLKENQ